MAMGHRWVGLVLLVGLGCGEGSDSIDHVGASGEFVDFVTVSGGWSTPVTPQQDVIVYPFVGYYDPQSGVRIEYDDGYDWTQPLFDNRWAPLQTRQRSHEEALKNAEGGIPSSGWFDIRVTEGRPGTFSLMTLPGSIGLTPSDCGFPTMFPYISSGIFCFDAQVTSYLTWPTTEVYAELTSVSPEPGYYGYAYPFGTGANAVDVTPDCGPPGSSSNIGTPSAALGLWAHGAIDSGSTATTQWVFQNDGGAFSFRGRLVAMSDEDCSDLVDNDCDGYANDGCTGGQCCASNAPGLQPGECGGPVGACPAGEDCGICGIGVDLAGVCIPEGSPSPPCD